MKNLDVHFSSKSNEWATPRDFFDKLNALYAFDLDVCASAENAKCKRYYDKAANGLRQVWRGVCWMNPPYGREISSWIKKAYESAQGGATVVCLIPARTDTSYWHDYVMKGDITFIRGRLKFNDGKSPAPFPSALVVFKPSKRKKPK